MEAIPKLPMLYFELKMSPSNPDFATPFKSFIMEHYQEDPESYNKEIKELENLRINACRAPRDVTGCALLKRYYSQIYSLMNRFKIHNSSLEVQFAWLDVYTEQTIYGDMNFELACILYNIGALHAELGAIDQRNTDKSMKVACTHFQCAAWAFEHIRDNPAGNRSKDLSHDLLSFLVHIMMAQAQECILEKSILDNRKASIISKVAAQVCDYYNSALLVLLQAALGNTDNSVFDIVGSKLYKEWKRFIELKISYYNAICCLFMGILCEEQQKSGERIAWFQNAEEKFKDAANQAKRLDKPETSESILFLNDVISEKLSNAKRENDFVYHENVPTSDKLTAVKGASLVKGISFSVSDPDVCGQDIFSRLVPIQAHEIASIYTSSKDQIMRDVRNKVDSKNQELDAYVNSLQLDLKGIRPNHGEVPDELIEICAAMSINANAVQDVYKLFKKLDDIYEETDEIIKQTRKSIAENEASEKKHQEITGKKTSSNIIVELEKELRKHEEAHTKAKISNEAVAKSFEVHRPNIELLLTTSGQGLNNLLPSANSIPLDETNIAELEKLMSKVKEMKSQRASFENQLREAIHKDDVMTKVLSHSKDEIEKIFDTEIKKFEKITALLDQNLSAQENILNALTKANAKYAHTRRAVLDSEQQRQERVEQLIISYETYQDVLTNTEKGIDFYEKFKDIVSRLQARVRSVTRIQEEERALAISRLAPKPLPKVPVPDPYHSANSMPQQHYQPQPNNFGEMPSYAPAPQQPRPNAVAQKLEEMRLKKQEAMQQQHQLALQRLQEQSRGVQARQDQFSAQHWQHSTQPVYQPPTDYAFSNQYQTPTTLPQTQYSHPTGIQQPQYGHTSNVVDSYTPPVAHYPMPNQGPPTSQTGYAVNTVVEQHKQITTDTTLPYQQHPQNNGTSYNTPTSAGYNPYNMQQLNQYLPSNNPPQSPNYHQVPVLTPQTVSSQGYNGAGQVHHDTSSYAYAPVLTPQPFNGHQTHAANPQHDPNNGPLINFDS